MGHDYVESRIREALRLNGGNEAKTKRQVHAWLYEDHKFLLELTQPHLNGIIAYAVGRTKNMMMTQDAQDAAIAAADAVLNPTAPKKESAAAAAAKARKEGDFGETMLRSFISGNSARFGYEGSSAPVRRKAASQSHIDTIHLLAAAGRKKQGTPPTDQE